MIVLTLPYPVSANRYWKAVTIPGRTMMVPSKEAKEYRDQVGWIARAAGVRKPIEGRVALTVQLYPQRPLDWAKRMRLEGAAWDDSVRCIDLDNANKVLLDAIKAVVIDDDRWVRRLVSERMEPDEHGARVVLRIEPMAVEQPQAELIG
jgi:crossover junction endodeoxyribonuclease RusA